MGADKKIFSPPWWLRNRHVQSCVGAVFGARVKHLVRWEEFNLADGDFIDLAWIGDSDKPLVFILTGFEGELDSHYVQLMAQNIIDHGWQVCVLHYRGCSGRVNRLPRTYHVGDFTDFHQVLAAQKKLHPDIPCFAVGFSMGSNVLVKYLDHFPQSPLQAGCLVSCPYQVNESVDYCGYFYQRRFVISLVAKLIAKIKAGHRIPLDHDEIMKIKYMRELDRLVTAPMFNYKDESDYYNYATVHDDLVDISTPLLLLHAEDDPIAPISCVPSVDKLNANSSLFVSGQGGHIGFMGAGYPWQLDFWVGKQIMDFFDAEK